MRSTVVIRTDTSTLRFSSCRKTCRGPPAASPLSLSAGAVAVAISAYRCDRTTIMYRLGIGRPMRSRMYNITVLVNSNRHMETIDGDIVLFEQNWLT